MNYGSIRGFCNFDNIYAQQVNAAQSGACFVEIGSLFGRSTAAMGKYIKDSGKEIEFYSIDFWDLRGITDGKWSSEDLRYFKTLGLTDHTDPDIALRATSIALVRCGVSDQVKMLRMDSRKAVDLFEDGSVDFLFIDGDHHYENVLEDINLWLPKIKDDGVMAGHDYDWSGVRQAVDESFENIKQDGTSWIYVKKETE